MVFATVNKCIALDVIAVVVSIALDLLCIAIRRSTVQRTNVVLCNYTLSADEISGTGLNILNDIPPVCVSLLFLVYAFIDFPPQLLKLPFSIIFLIGLLDSCSMRKFRIVSCFLLNA